MPIQTWGNMTVNGNYIIASTNSNHLTYEWMGQQPPEDHDKEQDMAQRHDFTFPYTGQEIADALSRKIAALTDKITALHSINDDALSLIIDLERDDNLKRKVDRQVKELQKAVEKLVAERVPYAKAAKQTFDIDLEDIEHFGLNAEDAPTSKPRRTRRTKEQIEADKAAAAA